MRVAHLETRQHEGQPERFGDDLREGRDAALADFLRGGLPDGDAVCQQFDPGAGRGHHRRVNGRGHPDPAQPIALPPHAGPGVAPGPAEAFRALVVTTQQRVSGPRFARLGVDGRVIAAADFDGV